MIRTKILATIGPMTRSKRMILGLISAGMRMARLNMSHGVPDDHSLTIALLREAAEESGVHLPILLDLQGPKIRVGRLQNGSVNLVKGAVVELIPEDIVGDARHIPVLHQALLQDTAAGHPILLDDGAMRLHVVSVNEASVSAKVIYPGVLKDRKGVNLPGVDVSVPSLSEKDLADLEWGIGKGVDYVALSFVRRASDVTELRERIAAMGVDTPIIAKIEKPQAVDELDGIIEAADAVMVARGDLGVEFPPEKVPMLQKDIILRANLAHKPVITATQMLESMIESPRPTRAEASDVANAILDGSDAVMLSGETAVGRYPVEAVQHMRRISVEAENALLNASDRRKRLSEIGKAGALQSTLAIGHSAVSAADDLGAKAIVCFTHSGATPLVMSKFRPLAPVVALCSSASVARRAQLYWGVTPTLSQAEGSAEMLIWDLERAATECGAAKSGDEIIMTGGVPMQGVGKTNFMKIHTIG